MVHQVEVRVTDTPAADLTRTWPGPGLGRGTSAIVAGFPAPLNRTAFVVTAWSA
jgi:hypothetical protein